MSTTTTAAAAATATNASRYNTQSLSSQQQQQQQQQRPSYDTILSWDVLALSDNLHKYRTVSCVDVMTATIERIQQVNPKHNALIMVKPTEELLSQAREADERLSRMLPESNDVNSIPRLYGIPTAIKDVSSVQGLPTTMGGSPIFDSLRPSSTSDMYVENMVSIGGMIVVGKTNVPECALGSNTFNDKWGATLNAYDVHKTAGGSSGGASVAIATGMLIVADGTDNMGSLRNPAGWNNIYSLRPTAGLVPEKVEAHHDPESQSSTGNNVPTKNIDMEVLGHPASTPGPMARTPLDCAILLETMVGGRTRFDASPLIERHRSGRSKELDKPVRIGWLKDWGGILPIEDGILEQCKNSLSSWNRSSSGQVEVVDVDDDMFPFEKLWAAYNTMRFASTFEKYTAMDDLDVNTIVAAYRNGMEPLPVPIKNELAWELEQGRKVTRADLEASRAVHESFEEWFQALLNVHNIDAVALPSAQVWPFPIEMRYPKVIAGRPMKTYHEWMSVSIPVSFAGLPCVTIPAGFGRPVERTERNKKHLELPMPMGIQLFSKRGDDVKLVCLAMHHNESTKTSVDGSAR